MTGIIFFDEDMIFLAGVFGAARAGGGDVETPCVALLFFYGGGENVLPAIGPRDCLGRWGPQAGAKPDGTGDGNGAQTSHQ